MRPFYPSLARPQDEPDDIDEWLQATIDATDGDDHVGPPILSFAADGPVEETKRLRFRTAREIAAATADEVDFAAAYLAFGAITELDGRPKAAGKTTFVLALVRAILDGAPFLGRPTVAGPVVMLTEQPPASLGAALRRAGLAEREDFVLLSWAEAAGTPWPAMVKAAAAKCRELGARVLVVDTLPQFAGLRGDAENNSGDALAAVEPLQLLAAEGFAILVTRHDRKSGGEVGESARGSGAFTGAVDIVLAIARDTHDSRQTMRHLTCLSRFTETAPELVIELLDERYEVIGTSAQALAAAQREKLLAGLSEEPARFEEIARLIGEPPASVRALLNTLFAEGVVSRHGAGHRGDPYVWSQAAGDGDGFPFVPLRGTHERKATTPYPRDDELAVEDDYPPSAFPNEED